MRITQEQMDIFGRARFVQRMAETLVVSQAVDTTTDRKLLNTLVAQTLDEAADRGIKSERLMGMYVLLRLVDKVDPYTVRDYLSVLLDKNMAEDDKAHVLQMIRIGEVKMSSGVL